MIVLYGGANGLTSTGSQIWNADTVLESGNDIEFQARFGFSLAAGDYDKDGYGDLAIAAPFKEIGSTTNEGKVYVLRGARDLVISASNEGVIPSAGGAEVPGAGQIHAIYSGAGGLSATNSQVWSVDSPGVPRNLNPDEGFGNSLR